MITFEFNGGYFLICPGSANFWRNNNSGRKELNILNVIESDSNFLEWNIVKFMIYDKKIHLLYYCLYYTQHQLLILNIVPSYCDEGPGENIKNKHEIYYKYIVRIIW